MREIKINVKDFSLNKTLRSEQCVADLFFLDSIQGYWITYMPINEIWTKVMLKQDKDILTVRYTPNKVDKEELIYKINYMFSLNEDYSSFIEKFKEDKYLMEVFKTSKGIRIMKDFNREYRIIESLLTQNTTVKMIKIMQRNLFINYGCRVKVEDEIIYTYPDINRIANDDVRAIKEKLKCGYRAEYIKILANAILSGQLDINEIDTLDTDSARQYLLNFKGIGPKVADLILMYGFSKKDVFPTDIWARRTIGKVYFEGEEPSPKKIRNFVKEYFGEYASLINLMIFYFERRNKNNFFNICIWR